MSKNINLKALDEITDKLVAEPQQLPIPRQTLLIGHEIEGEIVPQRPKDGYINATALCRATGKLFADYSRLSSTQAFLRELSNDMGIPITALIQTLKGGNRPELQGTWVHPQAAINLAQWLSPKFAVQVSKWVLEWTTGQVSGRMPIHVRRYMKNRTKIPHTHFSILNEIYLNLIAPLEEFGFHLPDRLLPDASTGRIFSSFLRKKGLNPNDYPTYDHEFSDHRPVVKARLYPVELLADFRIFFNEEWLPKRAKKYFAERAPKALPYVEKITPLEISSNGVQLKPDRQLKE